MGRRQARMLTGLVIRQEPIDKILAGSKTWEIIGVQPQHAIQADLRLGSKARASPQEAGSVPSSPWSDHLGKTKPCCYSLCFARTQKLTVRELMT